LRVSRTKARKKNSVPGCKTGERGLVPSAKELVLTFGAIRRSKLSPGKKRKKLAESLQLLEPLYTPKYMYAVGKGSYTLYTHAFTGKVLGRSNKPFTGSMYICTRNYDYAEYVGMDRKIICMQYWLHLLTMTRLTLSSAKVLRRMSIVFGSINTKVYRRIVGRQTSALRATLFEEDRRLDTKPCRKPNRNPGGAHPSYRRGVVIDQRHGQIPILELVKGSRGAVKHRD